MAPDTAAPRAPKRRCACRPGCLTWLYTTDQVVETDAGAALATHLQIDPYPDADIDVLAENDLSGAWERWTARDNQLLQQTVFAEHIEDSLPDIAEPDGATMLEIAQSFQARTNVRFESSRMLQSGQRQLVYQEETTTAAGEKGTLEVPKEMILGLAPFEVGELYKVTARIRFRITNGTLTIGYKLDRPVDVLRQAFADVVSEVQQRTGMNVLYGTPPTGPD